MSRGLGRVYRPTWRDPETGARKTAATWWLDYSTRGARHREPAHTTSRAEALRLLRQRYADRDAGKLVGAPERVTFAELRELAERQYVLDGRRALWRVQLAFNHLARCFGPDRALDLTASRVDAYQERRLAEGAARATVHRELGVLRRAFRLAVEKGLLAVMPLIKLPRLDNARTGFFEADDCSALLAALPADLRPPVAFLYLTGWRKSEVLRLTWADVDFAAGVVRLQVGTTKNGEGRTFPFAGFPQLATVLQEQRAHTDRVERATRRIVAHVFHRNGVPIRDFYGAWRAACRRAAVREAAGRQVVVRPALLGRIPHDFRRTAVRNLVRAGVPERVAMQLTGHKTRAVFDRYNIVNEGDLAVGVGKLGGFLRQRSGKVAPGRGPAAEVRAAGVT